jgi:hypothetical protein
MIAETLSRPGGDEILRMVGIFLALVLAGLLAGYAEFLSASRTHPRPAPAAAIQLLVASVVCSLTCPLFLAVVSSNILSDGGPIAQGVLRIFCVALGYTLILRKLLARTPLWNEAVRSGSSERRLTLLDVEILRAVERSPLFEGSLPELPEDLRASPSVLALKMRALMDSGLVGVRPTDASRQELFVTAAGWSRLNAALGEQLW